MTLSEELIYRGLIKDKTFDDPAWVDTPRAFYFGVDGGSADSLQVGNLAALLMAKRMARVGWKTVLLVGGATSLIGDPGGKTEERDLKSKEEIDKNVAGIQEQVERLFAGEQFDVVNNYDWSKDLKLLDFLREVGKHYPMSELVNREFISERLSESGSGISFAEFSYTLLQGYDFWHLYKNKQVELQIGGSDQWGNMLSGVGLIRKREGAEAHALSMPLVINKATGKKFGKSEDGAVWLDSNKTSVYKFYQFWLNADDEGVEDYLKIFTELTKEEIETVMEEFRMNRGARKAQKTLAYEVTKLVHGAENAEAVRRTTDVLFGDEDFLALSSEERQILKQELQVVTASNDVFLPALIVQAGLASSNSEASRFLGSGAIVINGQKAGSESSNLLRSGDNLLKRGKNNFAVIEYK